MSSVKKLSLSGFKSTFKRKTSRGSTKTNIDNVQQAAQQEHRYVCDNESTGTKTNDHYLKSVTTNGLDNGPTEQNVLIHDNVMNKKTQGSKTGRWGFRQKSEKSKICDHTVNGNIDTMPSADAGVDHLPGSGIINDNAANCSSPSPPSVNGHVLMRSSKVNANESGYVGARWSKTPPQSVNCHYINDKTSQKTDVVNVSASNTNMMKQTAFSYEEEQSKGTDGDIDGDNHKCLNSHSSVHVDQGGNLNMKCDVNDNAEFFEERLDSCLELEASSSGGQSECDDEPSKRVIHDPENCEKSVSEDLPPAIPPKPALYFNNGQWVLQRSNGSVQSENQKNFPLDDGGDVPPRPPARSKTRCGIDTSLPFYKKYLELQEKSFQPSPIYEDVTVDVGSGSGGLAGELSKLPRQPWYWGPMAQDEAEEKLADAADGSFLVRDSSDERYLLTLSFKSNGRTLHTRIEHRNGLFSLSDSEGHVSVIELIHNAVRESQKGVFGYMNYSTGIQNYPARLTQWVSRYSEVKSLQYLCRFVIRETYPRHHIRHLPLPKKINEYILENQY